jgi:pimeloyl-ACP methyl ester carboxylesterase
MLSRIPQLIALIASPAVAFALEPASSVSSVDGTRMSSITDTASVGAQSLGTGMPTYGAQPSGSGAKTGASMGSISVGERTMRYYRLQIDPGTGFLEDFILYEPVPKPVVPAPLLVAFHAFGVTQNDILVNTKFLQQCSARGWHMLAPLSASGGHFMSDPGQQNTCAALDAVLPWFKIDKSRIYGVGFSMGGGMALNYAARHLDPAHAMFAAVVDHTGAIDLNETYRKDPSSQFIFDFWYGDGSPGSANTFLMTKSSLIVYDDITQQVDPNSDLARNLSHLPIQMVRAQNDPLILLAQQHDRLYAHMTSQGRVPGPAFSSQIIPGVDVHKWSTLDPVQSCDWLSQFSLQMPSSARTLALKDGPHFFFYVDQQVLGQLTPFTWSVDTSTNRLDFSETVNVESLVADTLAAGLSTTQPLLVTTSTSDGAADRISVRGYNAVPSAVLRDGQTALYGAWTYSPSAKMVTLKELDGTQQHNWTVIP